jgi:hypothetical protein
LFWNFSSPAMEPPVIMSRQRPRSHRPRCSDSCSFAAGRRVGTAFSVVGLAAEHQALAAADEHAHGAVVGRSVVTCTMLICEMSWSRWSSRSFGVWPLPLSAGDLVVEVATCWRAIDDNTASACPLATPACSAVSCSPAALKRAASSWARVSTTWRAEASFGLLATSTNAFRNWPRVAEALGRRWEDVLELRSWLERVGVGHGRDDAAAAACVVRNSSCERVTS